MSRLYRSVCSRSLRGRSHHAEQPRQGLPVARETQKALEKHNEAPVDLPGNRVTEVWEAFALNNHRHGLPVARRDAKALEK